MVKLVEGIWLAGKREKEEGKVGEGNRNIHGCCIRLLLHQTSLFQQYVTPESSVGVVSEPAIISVLLLLNISPKLNPLSVPRCFKIMPKKSGRSLDLVSRPSDLFPGEAHMQVSLLHHTLRCDERPNED